MSKNNKKKSRGFALLFAVMTASVLLSIGLSIFNISLKELILSTASRDSQVAFYAADSARECILYWDVKIGAFPTCVGEGCDENNFLPGEPNIVCAGKTINFNRTEYRDGETEYRSSGSFFYPDSEGNDTLGTIPDAEFVISKEYSSGDIITILSTLGHNAGIGERRLERGLLQTY